MRARRRQRGRGQVRAEPSPGLVRAGGKSGQADVLQAQRVEVREAFGFDALLSARRTVDDHRDGDDVRAGLAQGECCLERGASGRGRVLEDDDVLAHDVRALDAALHAVVLRGLTHDERVQVQTTRRRRVEHRGRDRVGTHRQPADGHVLLAHREARLLQEIQHDVADEGSRLVVQRRAAHVDVEVGLAARRQGDLLVDDGL